MWKYSVCVRVCAYVCIWTVFEVLKGRFIYVLNKMWVMINKEAETLLANGCSTARKLQGILGCNVVSQEGAFKTVAFNKIGFLAY